ncbi:MAG: MgtC/SapB family protein [Verrucomicrobiota bacterium]
MINDTGLLQSLGIALGLGLLVGLQREWEHNRLAGLRTFALVSLFGALSGMLAQAHGGWVMGGALIALAAITVPGYMASLREKEADPGLTTEIALLVMFATGAITMLGHHMVAVVIAGSVMVLLQGKKPLHQMVHRIGENDLREIARLVLIGLVILPVLPNRSFGYDGVLNPFAIWLMVVLIVGISLVAYLISKFLSPSRGAALTGILGGLISSTATTASVARRSHGPPGHAPALVAITLISAAVVFGRVIIEVMIVASGVASEVLPPLVAMMALAGIIAVGAYRFSLKSEPPSPGDTPPSELKGAVMFGLIYVVVLLAVSFAKEHFGQTGLFTVAALSGLTDMDAITLSTASLSQAGQLDASTAWRVIMTGGLANLLFKTALVIGMGSRFFIKPVILGFAAMLTGGAAILAFWP